MYNNHFKYLNIYTVAHAHLFIDIVQLDNVFYQMNTAI